RIRDPLEFAVVIKSAWRLSSKRHNSGEDIAGVDLDELRVESRAALPVGIPACHGPVVATPCRRHPPLKYRLINHRGVLDAIAKEDYLPRLGRWCRRNSPSCRKQSH